MDVLKIAICDDTVEECREVEACAARFFGDRRLKARIDTYKDMPELLAADEEYDLYLLDVLMPGMTGIEGAGALQKKVERPVVVFITSSLESAVDGYSVNAAGFVLKPVEAERLEATLERVLRQYLGERRAVLTVPPNRVPVQLKLEKVVYFENRLHRVYVALDDGELLTISHKLSELQEELEGFSQFLRCSSQPPSHPFQSPGPAPFSGQPYSGLPSGCIPLSAKPGKGPDKCPKHSFSLPFYLCKIVLFSCVIPPLSTNGIDKNPENAACGILWVLL